MTIPVAVIDCETDPFLRNRIPQPFIWGFYDGERFRHFATAKELMEYLAGQTLVVYAHNGGKFDYHYLLNYLEPYSPMLIINGRIASFKIGNCEFRDSCNIIPVPLSEYQKDTIDYRKFEANVREKWMSQIVAYLRSDCVYLYELVSTFRKDYGTRLTLAGTAIATLCKMSEISKPRSSPNFYNEFKDFYAGGRVECFHVGRIEKPFINLDINSAYPYAMVHEHPWGFEYNEYVPTHSHKLRDQSFYVVDAVSDGVLPWRNPLTRALEFPWDREVRRYHATGWEIRAGLETGTLDIVKWKSRKDFKRSINFKGYVDHFFKLKAASPKGSPAYLLAKLMLNAAYGVYAKNPSAYHNYGIVPKDESSEVMTLKFGKDQEDMTYTRAGFLGPWGLMQRALKTEEQHYVNVAVAASITGFVRAHLFRALHAITQAGGKLLYCDTDAVAFQSREMPRSIVLGPQLGAWGEPEYYSAGGIAGKKLYAWKKAGPLKEGEKPWKIAHKGVKLDHEEIMAIVDGAELTYLNPVPAYTWARGGGAVQARKGVVAGAGEGGGPGQNDTGQSHKPSTQTDLRFITREVKRTGKIGRKKP